MPVAVAKLTWDDIKDWPEGQLVDGEAIISPAPAESHRQICENIGDLIKPYVKSRRLGRFSRLPIHVILEPGVEYEPDCWFIANPGWGKLQLARSFSSAPSDRILHGYSYGAPDLIVEVISESNRSHDTVVKFRDYERSGVKEYWPVDPRASHVRVFHLTASGKYEALGVFAPGERIESRLFPDLAVDPAAIFAKE